jgi:ABC-type Zn uptake system ZnuABC Zn-binding protein ZnuA
MNFKKFLMLFLIACLNENKENKIVVSIYPIKLILNEIGVNSEVIIDKVVDIHSFEPNIKTLINAQNSCGFIYISENFETWAKNIKSKYKLKLLENNENPHIWTNPKFILKIIPKIENLLKLCSIHYNKENIENFIRKLKEIDSTNEEISKKLNTQFILFHASFEPFLRAYNLKIETILIKEGYYDILPSDLQKALNSKDKIIIVESYYSKDLLDVFKKRNFKIISLNPLGNEFKNYTDFIKAISDSILLNKYVSKVRL